MAIRLGSNDRVRIDRILTLSENWYVLRKVVFDWLRDSGEWQRQEREAYDRGNGAAALLYRRSSGTVILTRQFRMPGFLNGHNGMLIEAAAGLLDENDPEEAIRREIEEETGYRPTHVRKVLEAFMSPGSVTEKLHFFQAEIDESDRSDGGGGNMSEGEEIEVVELPLDEALAMVPTGGIADAKTIMLLQYLALNRSSLLNG